MKTLNIKAENRINLLSPAEIEKLHQASMRILGEAGIHLPAEEYLKVFADAGAEVDFETQNVKIPESLVWECLKKNPKTYVKGGRGGREYDLEFGNGATYTSTSGCASRIVDLNTGKPRNATKKDVGDMARLADYFDSNNIYWTILSAVDQPEQTINIHEAEAALRNTGKHVEIINCADPKQARYIVEMAKVVSGGEENMRKHPPLSYLACPVSPLVQKKDTIDSAMIFAEAGLPLGIATMPLVGGTAPTSQAGYIALGNAEILSLNCLIQLMYPGTGVYYALFSTSMNPYTGGCLSSTPNQPLLNTCPTQLAHYYGMPSVSGYGGVDENIPLNSLEMGHDLSIDALLCYFTGPDQILNFGLTDNDTLCYPQRLVIDDFIHSEIEAIARGLDFDHLNHAVEEIINIGTGGTFIASAWSAMNMRNYWQKNVRYQWDAPKKQFRDIVESAVEKAKWILANHIPPQLPQGADQELNRILAAADDELLNQ